MLHRLKQIAGSQLVLLLALSFISPAYIILNPQIATAGEINPGCYQVTEDRYASINCPASLQVSPNQCYNIVDAYHLELPCVGALYPGEICAPNSRYSGQAIPEGYGYTWCNYGGMSDGNIVRCRQGSDPETCIRQSIEEHDSGYNLQLLSNEEHCHNAGGTWNGSDCEGVEVTPTTCDEERGVCYTEEAREYLRKMGNCQASGGQWQSGDGGKCLPYQPKTNDCQGATVDSSNCGIMRYLALTINTLSILAGVVITASIVIGGIQYSSAGSDPQKTSAAKNRIRNAIIALVLFIFGYALLNYLIPGGLL